MKTTYFLFGEEAIGIMDSTGNIKDAVKVGCSTHSFTTGDDPADLLAAYSGWYDFCTITEEQYNKINELIEER